MVREITEPERGQQARDASEGRYQTWFEHAPDGILVADRESYYLDANPSICRMLGYSREELIGLHASDIVSPDERPHIGAALHLIETTAVYHRRWTFRRKDGSSFQAEVIATVTPDGNLLAMIRDVTEQMRAEAAVREERDRAQRYLDSADVILLALDLTGRVTLINRKGSELLGRAEPDLLGCDWVTTCVPTRLHESVAARLAGALAGDCAVVENPILTAAGDERLIEWRNSVLRDEAGRVTGTFSSGMDVTDRRSLERQYQQAQKMEGIGRLAGSVAHDFNNLLTAILGYCELLLAGREPADPAVADILEIQKAGQRAEGLTRQLLAFSRKQLVEPMPLDLNLVVADMRDLLERLIGEDVTVRLTLQPGLAQVQADRGQLEQVVMNLALNARDAMLRGGTLRIETANVHLDEHYAKTHIAVHPGAYVVLTVTDTGTGMPADVQARLFEPFFTTKEPGKGTGLGLATVHGIVMRSGGSIDVYSEVGRGTAFKVYLPQVAGSEAVAAAPMAPARKSTGAETVLVVEDADGLRELTQRLLERLGYTVLIAADAAEALTIFEGDPAIDVLLTDVVLPGISGPELIRQVIADRPGLRVIFMSGYTEETITHHGVLKPGVDFLQKPFTSDTLGRKIREVLDR
jgi:two-component system, cell cycle sensor histidine kinase and response regulator CckA